MITVHYYITYTTHIHIRVQYDLSIHTTHFILYSIQQVFFIDQGEGNREETRKKQRVVNQKREEPRGESRKQREQGRNRERRIKKKRKENRKEEESAGLMKEKEQKQRENKKRNQRDRGKIQERRVGNRGNKEEIGETN